MSPILRILMNETDHSVNTPEASVIKQEIVSMQEVIQKELSFEFLNHYSTLCNQRDVLEWEAQFERGFFTCAQLLIEILSKYSS